MEIGYKLFNGFIKRVIERGEDEFSVVFCLIYDV